jgi:hypothetical protein
VRSEVCVVATLGALIAAAGCGGADDGAARRDVRAAVAPFTPPSPPGCAGAGAYDYCLAFDHATPLAVRVELPSTAPAGAVGVVRFHLVDGAPAEVLNQTRFALPHARRELVFYFQVFPATYVVDIQVGDETATTLPLEIGNVPIETSLTL